MKIKNNDVKALKKTLMMPLGSEATKLIKKDTKDMSKSDVSLLSYLSRYNHWLAMAKTEAAEANKYYTIYCTEYNNQRKNELADIFYRKYSTVVLYLKRAADYLLKYKKMKAAVVPEPTSTLFLEKEKENSPAA